MKKNWLKCSRCGKRFSGLRPGEALNKMRKHLWKYHAEWMRRRIKGGQKKAKTHNPKWLTAVMTGVFPPANLGTIVAEYRTMTPDQRNALKTAVRGITVPLGPTGSAVAEAFIRGLDVAVQT